VLLGVCWLVAAQKTMRRVDVVVPAAVSVCHPRSGAECIKSSAQESVLQAGSQVGTLLFVGCSAFMPSYCVLLLTMHVCGGWV